MFKSLVAAWVALVMAFVSFVPGFVVPEDKSGETDKSYPYIFVHGFLGWGEDEGINQDFSPKFLRRYADLAGIINEAIGHYIKDVKSGDFPNENEQY